MVAATEHIGSLWYYSILIKYKYENKCYWGWRYFKNNYGFKILVEHLEDKRLNSYSQYLICIFISIFSDMKFTFIQASQQNSSYAIKNSTQNVLFVNYVFY